MFGDEFLKDPNRHRLPAMNHIAAVAMKHFAVPMSVVSLVTDNEVVFVGAQGLPDDYVPSDTNFCRLVSDHGDVLVVEDTLAVDLFKTNSAVTGPPFVRFFAGAPLTSHRGEKIGTICIADTQPRDLSFGQRIVLKHLARVAAQELVGRPAVA